MAGPKKFFDIETAAVKVMKDSATGKISNHLITDLQIRTEGGAKIVRVRCLRREKVSEIFKLIFAYRESKQYSDPSFFEFRTIMPIIGYDHDEKKTFQDLGFFPQKGLGLFVKKEH